MIGRKASYKGNRYLVEGAVKFRHTETGDWIEAYLYSPEKDASLPRRLALSLLAAATRLVLGGRERYVRERIDFEEKFKAEG